GKDPTPAGTRHHGRAPLELFETKDGFLLAGGVQKTWETLCQVLGVPEHLEDPRFATNADRLKHRDEVHEALAPAFRSRTTAEWDEVFAEAGSPVGPVNTFSEIMESEHVRANEMIGELEHPKAGRQRYLAPTIKGDGVVGPSTPAPLLGQHNREILLEAG